jgi:hypothetical protein
LGKALRNVQYLVAVAGYADVHFAVAFLPIEPAPLVLVPVPIGYQQIQQACAQKCFAIKMVVVVFNNFA